MAMLTNGPPKSLPGPQCSMDGHDRLGRKCAGKLHEYTVQMYATLDGTPVKDAPKEKTLICEGHYADSTDPTFSTCACRLCKERKGLD